MKTGKKSALRIVLCIAAIFLLLNAGWYGWRTVRYGAFTKGMEQNDLGTWIVPRYLHTDADGYDYSVKYPDYLSVTGNLSVGLPAEDDNPFTDFLVVWPKVFGGYGYGISLTEGATNYQIYLHEDGSAVDPRQREIAERNKETIEDLLQKADAMWDIR